MKMARLNNDTREILNNMIYEKSNKKRMMLNEQIRSIEDQSSADYKERVEKAKKELGSYAKNIESGVEAILRRHNLAYGTYRYDDTKYSFNDIYSSGRVRDNLEDYLSDALKETAEEKSLRKELDDLEDKVHKAKQELLLRAALGISYDEIMNIVNGFSF